MVRFPFWQIIGNWTFSAIKLSLKLLSIKFKLWNFYWSIVWIWAIRGFWGLSKNFVVILQGKMVNWNQEAVEIYLEMFTEVILEYFINLTFLPHNSVKRMHSSDAYFKTWMILVKKCIMSTKQSLIVVDRWWERTDISSHDKTEQINIRWWQKYFWGGTFSWLRRVWG